MSNVRVYYRPFIRTFQQFLYRRFVVTGNAIDDP